MDDLSISAPAVKSRPRRPRATSQQQAAILAHLATNPRATPQAVADALGKHRTTTRRLLSKLLARGAIVRGAGWYALPGAVPADEVLPPAPREATHPEPAKPHALNGSTAVASVNGSTEAVEVSEQATPVNSAPETGLRYRIVSSGEVHIERAPSLLPAVLALNQRLGPGAWRNLGWESAP